MMTVSQALSNDPQKTFKPGDKFTCGLKKAEIVQLDHSGGRICYLNPTRHCLWNSGNSYAVKNIDAISVQEVMVGLGGSWYPENCEFSLEELNKNKPVIRSGTRLREVDDDYWLTYRSDVGWFVIRIRDGYLRAADNIHKYPQFTAEISNFLCIGHMHVVE